MRQSVIRQLRARTARWSFIRCCLTDFHQAGKMEFHPGFDLARRNVRTTRFQTLRQLREPCPEVTRSPPCLRGRFVGSNSGAYGCPSEQSRRVGITEYRVDHHTAKLRDQSVSASSSPG